VGDPEFVDMVTFYVDVSQPLHGSVFRKALQTPIKKIAGFRLAHTFFKFTADKKIYEKVKGAVRKDVME
jgi:hypothetical protein